MKSISVRELRSAIPHLREILAQEHELLLVSNGEPLARILPVARILPMARKRDVPSLAGHRAGVCALAPGVLAGLVRDERDRA